MPSSTRAAPRATRRPLNSTSRSEAQQDLYGLSQADYNVIASGSNGGYYAAPGYNLVTGLGTPIANALVTDVIAGNFPATGQVAPLSASLNTNAGYNWTAATAFSTTNVFPALTSDAGRALSRGAADTLSSPVLPSRQTPLPIIHAVLPAAADDSAVALPLPTGDTGAGQDGALTATTGLVPASVNNSRVAAATGLGSVHATPPWASTMDGLANSRNGTSLDLGSPITGALSLLEMAADDLSSAWPSNGGDEVFVGDGASPISSGDDFSIKVA